MPSTIIIGAGMAGLSAASELQKQGWTVTVLDKGRGVGGRMATRRIEAGKADHGAQFFSARTPDFQAAVREMRSEGIVQVWDLQDADTPFTHPRYIGTDGMNAVAKYMGRSITVKTNERAIRVTSIQGGWRVITESGSQYEAESLLITCPVPQALALFQASNLPLSPQETDILTAITYEPCLAVMVVVNQAGLIPAPGYRRFDAASPIAWLVDNQQKGISPNLPTITIHASHWFSSKHLDEDLNQVGRTLIDEINSLLPASAVESYQVHRWRYSLANERYAEPYLAIQASSPLVVGGDGFGQGNVEGAFQSGLQMAKALARL